ncbi:MAG: phosphate/phosphite/phosphonate ABC transporter substrate-binding protein [Geminicoccaceae bacterium]
MYDLPTVRWATDALWRAIATALAARGVAAPAGLDRRAGYASAWREPGLLLSQTCGYPFVTGLRGEVWLVATPCYRAEGCVEADYRSVLLVREDDPADALADLRGRRVAYNALDSQSGHNALRAMVAPLARDGRFFAGRIATGAHAASMAAVADGEADLCAVDCVTWALLRRHEPERTHGLRAIGWTAAAPALPLITAVGGPVALLREALQAALADPENAPAREALLLDGFASRSDADYERILAMEREAIALGYPALG